MYIFTILCAHAYGRATIRPYRWCQYEVGSLQGQAERVKLLGLLPIDTGSLYHLKNQMTSLIHEHVTCAWPVRRRSQNHSTLGHRATGRRCVPALGGATRRRAATLKFGRPSTDVTIITHVSARAVTGGRSARRSGCTAYTGTASDPCASGSVASARRTERTSSCSLPTYTRTASHLCACVCAP